MGLLVSGAFHIEEMPLSCRHEKISDGSVPPFFILERRERSII